MLNGININSNLVFCGYKDVRKYQNTPCAAKDVIGGTLEKRDALYHQAHSDSVLGELSNHSNRLDVLHTMAC